MTREEFNVFSESLLTAFPDIAEWLRENSPNIEGTMSGWFKSLRECTLEECNAVVDSWLTGKRDLYKHYERSKMALHIRACVMFDRDKRDRFKFAERSSDEYQKVRREDYKPLSDYVPGLADAYRQGLLLNAMFAKGEIDEAELKRRRAEIVAAVK